MADIALLSALQAITGAATATGDLFLVEDVSLNVNDPNRLKKITRAELALAISSEGDFVPLAGGTMTGDLSFSGTTHAGLKLNSLTTTQKNALTAAAGNLVYDSTLGRVQSYDGAAWHSHLRLDGDTMLGDLKFTDASYDIGKSGATRPRDGFFSRNLVVGGTYNGYTPMNQAGDTMVGDLKFTDATYDIGKSGATRPRDGFFSRNLTIGGVAQAGAGSSSAPAYSFSGDTGTGFYSAAANKVIFATNAHLVAMFGDNTIRLNGNSNIGWASAGNDPTGSQSIGLGFPTSSLMTVDTSSNGNALGSLGLLKLIGGAAFSTSYPMWKRNGTAWNARLADDSADTAITAGGLTTSGARTKGTTTFSADRTVGSADHDLVYTGTGGNTLTLLAASSNAGREVEVFNDGSGSLTVDATGLGQIRTAGGAAANSVTLTAGNGLRFKAGNSKWTAY